jgi:multiple sugar transport system permease protein
LVSLALALALDSKHVMGKAVFRVGVFLPYAVPGVIAAVIWSYLYGPVFGPISQTSRALGMPAPPLLEEGWILFSLANITLWELAGYKMIIVYAALQAISGELEEAASLDGARSWQYALYVKVPLVMGAIVLNAVFSIIGTLQLFNEPSILKAMAPSVIPDHFTPNLYARALSFVGQEYNYAGAVSFTLAAVTAILSFILLWVVSRGRRASK